MLGVDDLITAGLKVLDKFVPDPAQKQKAEAELRKSLMEWDKSQTEINKVEAAHRNVFVAGWRPFIGWNCGIALSMHFVGLPIIQVVALYADFEPPVINFDMETLMTVLLGMLGLGGLRTYEKIKGISK